MSFIGTWGVKKEGCWLAWLKALNSKGNSQGPKHHLHIDDVRLIAYECC
jgi:hypothetical protein